LYYLENFLENRYSWKIKIEEEKEVEGIIFLKELTSYLSNCCTKITLLNKKAFPIKSGRLI
jgi:uncharacterized protein involved in tolerance to divalent cations